MGASIPASTIRTLASVADIDRATWDSCANPGWASERPLEAMERGDEPYSPFVSHDFLWCLEASGAASGRAGWTPRHIALAEADGRISGLMPAYLKSHSMGEYVFDHGWAEAYGRAGGRYYPKLQASVPFTPVTGRRLLVPPGPDRPGRQRALAAGAIEIAKRSGLSSVHVTFLPDDEAELCAALGYLQRTDRQFQFHNPGYRDFGDFLDALASRKRKAVRKEREEAVAGLAVETLTGAAITEADWDAFFAFYMDTGGRKWGRPYLNRRFFALLGERMADRVLLVMARRGSKRVAGALNLIGSDALYGRYWGAVESVPFLHFEVCYYQAIDWAIARGLARVEAGAQGDHKLARGYVPTLTRSVHWISDPAFRSAVAAFLDRERTDVEAEAQDLLVHAPFRKATPLEHD